MIELFLYSIMAICHIYTIVSIWRALLREQKERHDLMDRVLELELKNYRMKLEKLMPECKEVK